MNMSRIHVESILIIICLIIFFVSAAYLLLYSKDKMDAEQKFRMIREDTPDLSGFYEQNHDLIGWIRIDGTRIDYPVMQTPDDPEYYLHRGFSRDYSESGTPFMDAASIVVPRENATWNWLIYGHNMKFGTMFHDLQKYDSKEFLDKHRNFSFDVYDPNTGITEHGEYEIFTAAQSKIRAKNSDAFRYYQYAGFTDEQSFCEYIAGLKSESIYDTDITPGFGEQLVTLSTCAYHTAGGRLYIVGRRIN